MPTKAELEEEIDALNGSIKSLKGQVTKWKNKASAAPKVVEVEVEVEAAADDTVVDAANVLVDWVLSKGLDVQVGQKQLRLLCEALGREYSRGTG